MICELRKELDSRGGDLGRTLESAPLDDIFVDTLCEGKGSCTRCNHDGRPYFIEKKDGGILYECTECHLQWSLTSNTIFHKTRLEYKKWMQAVLYILKYPKITSETLRGYLRVTHKTAWRVRHHIRHAIAMIEAEKDQLKTLRDKIATLEVEKVELQDDCYRTKSQSQALRDSLEAKKKEHDQTKALKDKIVTLEAEKSTLQRHYDSVQRKCRTLRKRLDKGDTTLQRRCNNIQHRYHQLRKRLGEGDTDYLKMLRPWAYATYRQLSDEIVAEVWHRLADGMSVRQISIGLGLEAHSVYAIKRGRSYYAERLELVKKGIRLLSPRIQIILELRYGLDGGGRRTFDAIGKLLGLTRQRVQGLAQTALEKLRRRFKKHGDV
jgi:predicted nuclease with TOPRIM domain